ncbi:M48 family metallopeptidase [uncultured Methanomethylovorans sp.]|uniref:M48 family metallopeptidase n=1 Tax=uncultured Methanomethylovorans sp. TaxID=183759 RepID=UPI002AA90969|nr:M48 family metallopeptidase [uncultured Methanomethylovorans sp.]
MATNISSSIKINDSDIPYEVIFRKIKYPRLEYRHGNLKLIAPAGFREHEKLLNKHKIWIYRRFVAHKQRILFTAELELYSGRTEGQLQEYVESLIVSIGAELGVFPRKVAFRQMRTKWGSCSSKGNINLNTYLKHLPERLIEYVVFHEMVHLIEMNHGPRFKKLMQVKFHEHKTLEKQLHGYWLAIAEKYAV